MEKVKTQCPECGANLTISITSTQPSPQQYPETPATVDVVTERKLNTAEAKIKQLQDAGFDTSNLFSIRVSEDDYTIGRLGIGGMEIVPTDDPLYEAIRKSRVIPNRRLFRRWVMAQVFYMMTEKDYKTGKPIGFTNALKKKGYKYQWKVVVEELRVQAQLYQNDMENYRERNRWFNFMVVEEMMSHYIQQLKEIIGTIKTKKCKGVPYIHLGGKNIFVSDIDTKVFKPLERVLTMFSNADSPAALYKATKRFYDYAKQIYVKYEMPQCKAFQDAYKGAGAYFTLKNLILFHECNFEGRDTAGSIKILNHYSGIYTGWKLFGAMKAFMIDNHIDIEAKQREWRK